ncbi:MAG: hypothetical protein GX941_08060 [Candidatus Methanofastidiosa archaeon]|jgi:hypothetical protein|nr:hypothetical protein [Candidatus Methanofastidiosa archaeon]HPC81248.1 hypothetical protein [Methanofastidiosum sp.]
MSIYIKTFVEDSSNCYKSYAKTRHTKRMGVSKEMISIEEIKRRLMKEIISSFYIGIK